MQTPALKIAAALVLAIAAADAAATAHVSYIHPEAMTDVPRHHSELEAMESAFAEHLNHLSEQLPAGQVLTVEFLDIDLAGDVFPRVPVRDIRVTKGQADWPRMHLRYRIEQDGQLLRGGEQQLADPNYQLGINRYPQELYGYEKNMLDTWFRKEILSPKKP